MLRHLTLGLALCAVLTACSGGGSSNSSLPPSPGTSAPAGPQTVTMSIRIPGAGTAASGRLRRPAYVSAATESATIAVNAATPVTVNLTAGSSNCSTSGADLVCTVSVAAPVGADLFTETMYSGPNGSGSILSVGSTSFTIVAGQANVFTLTLSGVIAALSVTFTGQTPVLGTASSDNLAVNFKDAAGESIIGPAAFTTPISLSDSDGSGATSIVQGTTSATTVTLKSPGDAASLSLSYNGSSSFKQATLTASTGSLSANAVLTPTIPATVGFNDYTTFGYDNQRDVFNPNSTAITPASVNNGTLHAAWDNYIGITPDYNTQTQPIVATEIPGHQAVLFVGGGGSGAVYGYDGTTGTRIWYRNLGTEQYACENGQSIPFGIGGTVVYDPASQVIYVIGNANTSANSQATNTLFKISAADGSIVDQVNFAPPQSGWKSLDFSHTSVTLNNGIAYVGTAATCDISSWLGRVAAINVSSPMSLQNTFFTVWDPNNTRGGGAQPWGGGGIWGWGGVSIDFSGNVLTGVGNTDDGGTTHGSIVPPFYPSPAENSGLGEAFIKLSPDLTTLEDQNHPIPQSAYASVAADLDLQGTPAVFRPTSASGPSCNPLAALQSKSGALYIYDTTNIGRGPINQYQLAPGSYMDSFLGGPAFSSATDLLYEAVPTGSGGMYGPGMIAIRPGCNGTSSSVVWNTTFGPDSYGSGIPRSVPAVSAGGVVFVGTPCTSDGNGGCASTASHAISRSAQSTRRKPAICCSPAGNGEGALWALDASSGAVLNNGDPILITTGPIRVPPTIDGKWVFVLDNNGQMYGLTVDPSYGTASFTTRKVDSRMTRNMEAQPAAHD